MQRVPSLRDQNQTKGKAAPESSTKKSENSNSIQVAVKRNGSKRDESPSISNTRTRLGMRNVSPNTSTVSLKGVANKRLGRSDSLRNKSNPPSRSSSFNRSDSKPTLARPGLATLPREAGHRSRSQGDYVTVLEIGGGECRSKSASHRPSNKDASLVRSASRSNSLKRGGTVSVHIKHSQDVSSSHLLESRPVTARKQSIKIGRDDTSSSISSKRSTEYIDLSIFCLKLINPNSVTRLLEQSKPSSKQRHNCRVC